MSGTEPRKPPQLFCEHNRLHSGNLEALAAAQVLAGHHVVFTEHIRTRFGELGTVAVVATPGKLPLLGAYQPGNFVLPSLLAMGTIQVRHLLFLPLVKKIALVHSS